MISWIKRLQATQKNNNNNKKYIYAIEKNRVYRACCVYEMK